MAKLGSEKKNLGEKKDDERVFVAKFKTSCAPAIDKETTNEKADVILSTEEKKD